MMATWRNKYWCSSISFQNPDWYIAIIPEILEEGFQQWCITVANKTGNLTCLEQNINSALKKCKWAAFTCTCLWQQHSPAAPTAPALPEPSQRWVHERGTDWTLTSINYFYLNKPRASSTQFSFLPNFSCPIITLKIIYTYLYITNRFILLSIPLFI